MDLLEGLLDPSKYNAPLHNDVTNVLVANDEDPPSSRGWQIRIQYLINQFPSDHVTLVQFYCNRLEIRRGFNLILQSVTLV